MVSSTPQTARTQIKALANINKKLKKSIETKVFDNMEDMAKALMVEEIDASSMIPVIRARWKKLWRTLNPVRK